MFGSSKSVDIAAYQGEMDRNGDTGYAATEGNVTVDVSTGRLLGGSHIFLLAHVKSLGGVEWLRYATPVAGTQIRQDAVIGRSFDDLATNRMSMTRPPKVLDSVFGLRAGTLTHCILQRLPALS